MRMPTFRARPISISLCVLLFASCNRIEKESRIQVADVDFGEIDIRNIRAPIGIIRYKSDIPCDVSPQSCGCVKVVREQPFDPNNDWTEIEIAWTPKEIYGRQSTNVVIRPKGTKSDPEKDSDKVFRLIGDVACAPKPAESRLRLVKLLDSDEFSGELIFSRKRSSTTAPLELDLERTQLEGISVRTQRSESEFRDVDENRFQDVVRLDFTTSNQTAMSGLEIFWIGDDFASKVPIEFVVQGLVEVTPARIFLGVVKVDDVATGKFLIRSGRAYFPNCTYDLYLENCTYNISPSFSTERSVVLTFKADVPGRHEGTFEISFTDDDTAKIVVPVTVVVTKREVK